MTSNSVVPFAFRDHPVRVVMHDSAPWFVCTDVADALGYATAKDAARNLADNQKGRHILPTLGGDQTLTIINESGLYRLVLRSRKPEAVAFSDWVTGEVLPSIRKTGSYQAPAAEPERLRVRADFPFPDAPADRDHKAAEYSLGLLQASIHLYVDDPRARARMTEYLEHIGQCITRAYTEMQEAGVLMHFAGMYLKRWSSKKGAN